MIKAITFATAFTLSTLAFGQTAGSNTAPPVAKPVLVTAAPAPVTKDEPDFDKLAEEANAARKTIEDLCRALHDAEPITKTDKSAIALAKRRIAKTPAACAGYWAAHGAKPAAKPVSAADTNKTASLEIGKLVLVKCDGSHAVVPTAEPGTRVQLVGVCSPVALPTTAPAVIQVGDSRVIQGAATASSNASALAVASASGSGNASASASASANAGSQPTASGEIYVWVTPGSSAAKPGPCIVSRGDGGGLEMCNSISQKDALPGENASQYRLRVGGGTSERTLGIIKRT